MRVVLYLIFPFLAQFIGVIVSMWDLIVSVPDHCLFIFTLPSIYVRSQITLSTLHEHVCCYTPITSFNTKYLAALRRDNKVVRLIVI